VERAAQVALNRYMARYGGDCRAHSRPRPCEPCQRTSATQKVRWQSVERRRQHLNALARRSDFWDPIELAVLKEFAGRLSAVDIARRCTEVSGARRTSASVCAKAEALGLCLFRLGHTVNETAALFGVHAVTVRHWRAAGYIAGVAWGAKGSHWVFQTDEIEAFIRAEPWAFDASRMAPGRYRSLAEVVQRRDPWIRASVAAAAAGLGETALYRYLKQGLVECKQRNGHNGAVMVRTSVIPTFIEARQEAVRATRVRLLAMNHARGQRMKAAA